MDKAEDRFAELKRMVALAYQILYMEQIAVDDTLGHLSARLPGGQTVAVKPWGVGFDEVRPDNLVEMNIDGAKVGGGPGRLHSEMPLHCAIYKARSDVDCVIHVHPFYATLLTAVLERPCQADARGEKAAAHSIGFFDSSELIRSREMASAVAQALGTDNVLLLRNHGVVIAGALIAEAVARAVELERSAREQLSLPRERPLKTVFPAAKSAKNEAWSDSYWNDCFAYWCRKLQRVGQGTFCG